MQITKELAAKVLSVVDAGLVHGLGEPVPGKMCIEAAVNYAMGGEHNDRPACVGYAVRAFKICLNDAAWPTDKDRTNGMRKLAIAQLGSDKIDQNEFRKLVVVGTVKRILPIALRAAASLIPAHKDAMEEAAAACEAIVDFAAARMVARAALAAADAADAAADAAANAAADATAYATAYAATALLSARVKVLTIAAEIGLKALIALKSPGCEWLDLAEVGRGA